MQIIMVREGDIMSSNSYTQSQLSFTKNCLFDALLELMQTKPLAQITVRELTENAGVSRSSFYRNYSQITDIIVEFLDEKPMGWTKDITPEDYSAYDVTKGYYEYLTANKLFFTTLYKQNCLYFLLNEINLVFRGVFLPFVEKFGFHSKYEVSCFIGTVYQVTYDWIAGGMKEDLDEMIDLSTRLITPFANQQ